MPSENEYSLQDLADLADVSPRTVRYYVAQGLLPSPGQVGPGARYSDGHLARLRLIRRLQREHLPLAEIRTRLAGLDDETIAGLVEAEAPAPPDSSALDYVRSVLVRGDALARPLAPPAGAAPLASLREAPAQLLRRIEPGPSGAPYVVGRIELPAEPPPAPSTTPEPATQRSQWDRVTLTPDIELNIRRPLSRQQNKRVDRLIAIARELLEEDPS